MKRSEFEAKGDVHKAFESCNNSQRLIPSLPTVVRIDGKAFHTFTKGLDRPFDVNLRQAMVDTTIHLVKHFNAHLGYTQSDEISLVFQKTPDVFNGRVDKLLSLLSSNATSAFMLALSTSLPHKMKELPAFDARIWQLPSMEMATDYLHWRQADAERNSLTMLAHHHFGKKIEKQGFSAKHEMLHQIGVNWADMPEHFKRGLFIVKQTVTKTLTEQELSVIPEKHRPTGPVARSVVQSVSLPTVSAWKDNGISLEQLCQGEFK